jgi:cyclase
VFTFWPAVTFQDTLSLHVNCDDAELLHLPNGHTDGDAIVLLRKANVLFVADRGRWTGGLTMVC